MVPEPAASRLSGGEGFAPPRGEGFLAPQTVAGAVFEHLLDAIVSGRIEQGQRLKEEHLAERLGVSPAPVREALALLQQTGLVERLPRRGYRVVRMTEKDVEEIYDLREGLEVLALRLACQRVPPPPWERLEQIQEEGRRALEAGDEARHLAYNRALHLTIVQFAQNGRLLQAYQALNYQVQLLAATVSRLPGRRAESVAEHAAIIEAIRQGRVDEAQRLLAEHIRTAKERMLQQLRLTRSAG